MKGTLGATAAPFLLAVPFVLAALPAGLWAVALLGRTAPGDLSASWLGTFLLALLAVALWAYLAVDRRPGAALVPAAALAGVVLVALYGSDTTYHRFVHEPLLKGLALPLTAVLVLAAPVVVAGRDVAGLLAVRRRLVVTVTLGAVGALQAMHLVNVATDDLIRYWAIADAWLQGAGYPVTEGVPGNGGFYLIDQPFYPALIVPAFRLLGHRYLALHAPLILANVCLPFVFYALARAVGRAPIVSLGLALAALCVPYYQVYALGAADPEPLWAVAAGLLLLLALRVTDRRRTGPAPLWEWGALGLTGAAVALTRPEGTLYAGLALLGLAVHTRLRQRGWWLAAVLCGLPVAGFALFLWREFGVLSPSGWTQIGRTVHVLPNLTIVFTRDLRHYADVAGMPAPAATGLLLALLTLALLLLGLVRLWRAFPALRFVPLALAANLAVILMTPPDFAGDVMSPQTFLRHLSVLFPWLVPALALCLPARPRSPALVAAAFSALIVAELMVLGSVTSRVGAGQATILTSDPYVLVSDLWRAQDALPWLRIVPGEGRARRIDPQLDYLGFRRGLFGAVRPFDQHLNDAGRAHVLATGVVALAGLAGTGAGCAYAASTSRKASAAAATV